VIDLAVGIIIGAAFTAIVTALVTNIFIRSSGCCSTPPT
jgi:large-conductance mechanosensitive channel